MGGLQWWHFAFLALVLAVLALLVAALISISRSPHLDVTAKTIWIVACLFLQFFGPVAWFVWGRDLRPQPPTRPLY